MLRLSENGEGITAVQWTDARPVPSDALAHATPLLQETIRQLVAYFAGTRRSFDLPLSPQGTPFQLRTWQALREIPYGDTRTYRQIAEAIGCPKGARAVGLANNRNPVAILTPCHRVIGSDGRLVGYAGGLQTKEWLLTLERANRGGNGRLQ
jgi:methylated-DNA-[protein]-cysteine S-methyltransferase